MKRATALLSVATPMEASVRSPPLSLSSAFPQRPASAVLSDLAGFAAASEANGVDDATDVYGSGAWLSAFEAEMASAMGKKAGLFFPTGVCAQLAALCIHAGGVANTATGGLPRMRPSFVVHPSSHLLLHEHDAAKELLGFTPLIM